MTWEIAKRFDFSASHVLDGLPEGHQCGRLHGHNYAVELVLAAERLDETGFVLDYGALGEFKKWVDAEVDHRHLNDLVPFNPTAELLAEWFFDWCAERGWPIVAVRVMETPKTVAEFRASFRVPPRR